VLPFYGKLTWIGDISPDIINIPAQKESNTKLEKLVLNLGFMVCVLSDKYILKISLSDSTNRHGHSDKGQLVFCSSKDEVCDIGIGDLANTELSKKCAHSNWNFSDYEFCNKSNNQILLKFKNAEISCSRNSVEILFHLNAPDISILTNKIRGGNLKKVYKAEVHELYSSGPLSNLIDNNKIILCAE
jgi:hypothetical protein